MNNTEAIEMLRRFQEPEPWESPITDKAFEALEIAISALEKQAADKCCETCKYERLEIDAYPCSDCIRAKDHYEPYTEEES